MDSSHSYTRADMYVRNERTGITYVSRWHDGVTFEGDAFKAQVATFGALGYYGPWEAA